VLTKWCIEKMTVYTVVFSDTFGRTKKKNKKILFTFVSLPMFDY